MAEIGKRVGVRIRELRFAAGLTQAQLAERVGPTLAVESVSRIERGVHVPSLGRLEELVGALGATMDGFLASLVVEPLADASDVELRSVVDLLRGLPPARLRHVRRLLQAFLEVEEGSGP
jgi:transcriptional regulator with XRE-family HTH domain